ncbi:hypothetical protein ASO20_00930 [Mycoplasma sp. (ex Biomphalaria glabrata)]|uniref:lysylphosphatidylglycerol synthase transmembrane domain-containing protein n=1 Tax=Mycoplasma sp. (ex Biomphalaria glabrata) TaxID=1749074 RepID=UPI00073A7660|nr:lysylphosphatidylglycerol synthase domain-containing protein [Mycoplasma sp. (ex Biomphalaria glabrata)]ALV23233.1 hypothetical protein ASO20_00930 [Mycoplasma sp. (ex Biomphalaria glabrata)]
MPITARKPKSRTKLYLYMVMGILSLGILFGTLFGFILQDPDKILNFFRHTEWWAILLILMYPFLKGIIFGTLQKYIFHKYNISIPLWKTIVVFSLSNFLGVVTPFGLGGDAMKIYILRRNGFTSSQVLPGIIFVNIMNQVVSLIIIAFGGFYLLANPSFAESLFQIHQHDTKAINSNIGFGVIVIIFIAIGIFLQVTWGLTLLSVTVSGSFQKRIMKIVHWFTTKILKNRDLARVNEIKMNNTFEILAHDFKRFFKMPPVLFISFIMILMFFVYQGSLAYFAVVGIDKISSSDFPGMNIFETIIISIMVELANVFVPIPGGSGTLDLSFNYLMNNLLLFTSAPWMNKNDIASITTSTLLFIRIAITFSVIAWGLLFVIFIKIMKTKKKNEQLFFVDEFMDLILDVNKIRRDQRHNDFEEFFKELEIVYKDIQDHDQ